MREAAMLQHEPLLPSEASNGIRIKVFTADALKYCLVV